MWAPVPGEGGLEALPPGTLWSGAPLPADPAPARANNKRARPPPGVAVPTRQRHIPAAPSARSRLPLPIGSVLREAEE